MIFVALLRLKNGGSDYKGLDMAQEISETLREWSGSWKQLYLVGMFFQLYLQDLNFLISH